jgi:hypothetical protein
MANEKTYPNYLMHYRTKGSRNGISTTKGYNAVGQRAKGRWINGRYVYEDGSQNNWQQLGDAHRSSLTMNNTNRHVQDYRGMPASAVNEIIKRNNAKMEKRPEVKAFNAWYNARRQHNAEVAGINAAWEYQKANKQRLIDESNRSYDINQAKSAREGAQKQHNAEQAGREAALKQQQKASLRNAAAKGANNNWQQTANKTAGILGNMSREDRSLMKSREWVSRDKNGKKQVNNGFNVNNKYGYSNYTKDDKGWHDVHMGEYNTTGVKGVKKQQDWNTSFERNHRSDIGNAIADAKEDAKKAFKEAKADAKQTYVNLKSKLKSKIKKKKK